MFDRQTIIPESNLPTGAELLAAGRSLSSDWQLGTGQFQRTFGVRCEAEYKRRLQSEGRIMQHAHLGLRDIDRTDAVLKAVYGRCAERGARVDRIGLCLDWSMGFPKSIRERKMSGTGVLLNGPEDFQRLTDAVPSAMHFGDFMLGFPAALENTCAAIAAGATTIGNLGQYFTFRLPYYDDDIETTACTVKALGLIAAQPAEILVHSNLDDGFAAVFEDLVSALGMALVEKHIISDLVGAKYTVCYGHHFSEPMTRIAFQRALARICDDVPGSQIYGATVLYQGNSAENYAALASYLLCDIAAQKTLPTGHAINPVPVTENIRIPDAEEVIDAQLYLHRLTELAEGYLPVLDFQIIDQTADRLVEGGQAFARGLLSACADAGIDCDDPFELLLCLRRLGGRRIESLFGIGKRRTDHPHRRIPVVPASTYIHIEETARGFLNSAKGDDLRNLGRKGLRILSATTDVHEHGKALVDSIFSGAEIELVDGGVSNDPDKIVEIACRKEVNAIAVSTYNGVALSFTKALLSAMRDNELDIPVLIGGRLNQIPENSNTSLPVDVTRQLQGLGVYPCEDLNAAVHALQSALPENIPRDGANRAEQADAVLLR